MISKCVWSAFFSASWLNFLENVLSIMGVGLIMELILWFWALTYMIVGGIVYPGAMEGLLVKPFPDLGLKMINVCFVWENNGAALNLLVMQITIWDPGTHCVAATRDNLVLVWFEVLTQLSLSSTWVSVQHHTLLRSLFYHVPPLLVSVISMLCLGLAIL